MVLATSKVVTRSHFASVGGDWQSHGDGEWTESGRLCDSVPISDSSRIARPDGDCVVSLVASAFAHDGKTRWEPCSAGFERPDECDPSKAQLGRAW